ncbi:hypothetical protein BHE74_00006673 [Ensete ventricosum]|uniref:Uncharacterized protein n=1 Tax=Ensete ventricosum TaxID=4639 RepID=A0A444EY01_ENSVE|nr:hypothetical protein B296_00006031 [Ensete ventricosum]RWW15227.1 hypothetical protein GW17_00020939 [Ensete ventricosum]RWW84704.1 hypothetical protein BHE74_00006673 [Ensete ventricosum]RZR78268.1 hypothetical protein BHM03_00003561 [Ensete ventricosum]
MFLLSLHGQAQAKKLRAEKLLAKIEASMVPVNPSNDQETITDEERSVFRRIGLRMKAYLPLGQFLVPKGFALIYYRGKNYQRPISLRPRNLLTKAKALKRAVAIQRHEALSQHIDELEKTIKQMKEELGVSEDELIVADDWKTQSDDDSCSSNVCMEDEDSSLDSEDDDDSVFYDSDVDETLRS